MFSGCSDGSCGILWSFQMKVWTLMIQRNSMIPNYSMVPAIWWPSAIRWSPAIRWPPAIRWSIGSIDFDNPKVYGDTSISDGLVSTEGALRRPVTKYLIHYYFYFPISLLLGFNVIAPSTLKSYYNDGTKMKTERQKDRKTERRKDRKTERQKDR